jgi:prepilin peptidase CpaA
MPTLLHALIPLVLMTAVITDITRGKIYNWLTLPAFFLVSIVVMTQIPFDQISDHIFSLIGMMVLSIPIFSMGWMGGGDVKLLYVLALSLPFGLFFPLLFYIAICGGIYAGVQTVFWHHKKTLPYAIPIFMGYMVFRLMQGYDLLV